MSLFGSKFNVFKKIFTRLFHLEYISSYIRLYDIITNTCIINIKLPFIVSDEYEDLITSLYIQIFKHSDSFYLRYDEEEFNLYNKVRTTIDDYISINIEREQLYKYLQPLILDTSIERSHNLFFKRIPSEYFIENVSKICELNSKIERINDDLYLENHQYLMSI